MLKRLISCFALAAFSMLAYAADDSASIEEFQVGASTSDGTGLSVGGSVNQLKIVDIPRLYAAKICVMPMNSTTYFAIPKAGTLARYNHFTTVTGNTWSFTFSANGKAAVISSTGGQFPTSMYFAKGAYYTAPFTHASSSDHGKIETIGGVDYDGPDNINSVFSFFPTVGTAKTIFGECVDNPGLTPDYELNGPSPTPEPDPEPVDPTPPPPSAIAGVIFDSIKTQGSSTGSEIFLDTPESWRSGGVAGKFLLAVFTGWIGELDSAPPGWVIGGTINQGGPDGAVVGWAWKIGGIAEPDTVRFSGIQEITGGIISASNVDVNNPIRMVQSTSNQSNNSMPMPMNITGVTVSEGDGVVVVGAPDATNDSLRFSFSPPSAYIERFEESTIGWSALSVATHDSHPAGSTGSLLMTASNSSGDGTAGYMGYVIGLRAGTGAPSNHYMLANRPSTSSSIYQSVTDTTITDYSTSDYSEDWLVRAGFWERGLLRFDDLSNLHFDGKTISNAKLTLHEFDMSSTFNIAIRRLLKPFEQTEVTYAKASNSLNWAGNGVIHASDRDPATTLTFTELNIVNGDNGARVEITGPALDALVQEAINGNNYGWILDTDFAGGDGFFTFDSSQAPHEFSRPTLEFDTN